MVTRLQSVLFRAVPTVLILGLAIYTVVGPSGLVEERKLARKAEEAREAWLDREKAVDAKVFEALRLGRDPVEVERLVADELGLARPGATLYEFAEDGEGDQLVDPAPEGAEAAAPAEPMPAATTAEGAAAPAAEP